MLAALLVALSVADPFHLRHARWFVVGLSLLTVVLATAAVTVAVRVRVLQVLVVVVGGALAFGWALVAYLAIGVDDPRSAVSEVVSGDQRLVVEEGAAYSVDPVFRVVLRSGAGPFEQESLVWQGMAEGPAPAEVAFRGVDEVQVRVGSCTYVSHVEPVTLAVDPVHRPERQDGC